jgi:hypothetical protein
VLPTFPPYDVWRDADQDTRAPTGSFVHFVFDVPGVEEEPKFTFSKATRRWRLEGLSLSRTHTCTRTHLPPSILSTHTHTGGA